MNFELCSRFVEEDFCRLCLTGNYALRPLFPTEGAPESSKSLVSKISLLTEIIIDPWEELNARICSRCFKQLEDFTSFRRLCKDSDSQIRKMRTFRRQQNREVGSASVVEDSDGVTEKRSSECIATTTSSRYGGVFDTVEYCVDADAPGEYRMLFDGCVFRRKSLLVWRCEIATCSCQLLVQHDGSKCCIYGVHSHEKNPRSNDPRKFERMNQRICGFFNKLCDQINGTSENRTKECGSPKEQQQMISNAQQPDSMSNDQAAIYYCPKDDRPSIVVNGHRYYKEGTTPSSSIMPSKIYWRCSDKNCLGLVVTTADLHVCQLQKSHNHEPVANGSSILMEDNAVRVIVASMMNQTPQPVDAEIASELPNTTIATNIQLSRRASLPRISVVQKTNLMDRPLKLSADKRQGTGSVGQTVSAQRLPGVIFPSGSSNITSSRKVRTFMECFAALPPVTPMATSSETRQGTKPQSIPTQQPSISKPRANPAPRNVTPYKRKKTPITAAQEPPQQLTPPKKSFPLSCTRFFRCPSTKGIGMVFKQFVYSLKQPTGNYITWQCKTAFCDAQARSCWQFTYMSVYAEHNHEPVQDEQTVDVERHLTKQDALKELLQLRNNLTLGGGNVGAKGK